MYQYNNCLNNNTRELLNNSLDFGINPDPIDQTGS